MIAIWVLFLLKIRDAVVLVVTGEPGIGKTFLIEKFFQTHQKCHYVYGKNEQLGGADFAAVSQIIEQITNYALTLSKENLRKARIKLEKAIGNDVSLLYKINPHIRQIMEHAVQSTNSDLIKTKYRVKNAVFNYVSVIAEHCFPLAVFIDDLQWADTLCIEVVKTLVKKIDRSNIMLVLSFRSDETSELLDKLKPVLNERAVFMSIGQFRYEDILEYIHLMLPGRFKNIDEFALLIERITRGNPFYVDRLLRMFLHDETIRQESDEWKISLKQNNKYRTTSAENLLGSIIQNHHSKDQFLLDLISCFQNVDIRIIEETSGLSKNEISGHIQDLIEASILTRIETQGSISIAYSHDIIGKLVYGKISREKKEDIHYYIAGRIIQGEYREGTDDIIASHLLQSNIKAIAADADRWIDLLFRSGLNRKMIALVEQARQIFELCIEILPGCQSKDRLFEVQVMLECAECYCLLDRAEEAQQMIETLLENNKDKDIVEAIKIKQLYIYHYQRQHKQIIESGIVLLSQMGLKVSKLNMPANLLELKKLYSKKGIRRIGSQPKVTDSRMLKTLDILTLMTICATLSDNDMGACLCLKAAVYCGKSGNSPSSVIGYVAGAYIMLTVWKDRSKAYMLEDAILELLDKTDDKNKAFAYFIFGTYFSLFSKTLIKSEEHLDKSIQYGEAVGDFIFLGYSVLTSLDNKAFMGITLKDISEYIQRIETDYADLEQNNVKYNLLVHKEHITALQYGTVCFDENSISSKFEQLTEFEKYTEKGLMIQRMYFFGEIEKAFALAEVIAENIFSLEGMISSVDIQLFEALIRTKHHEKLTEKNKMQNIRRLKDILKISKKWSGLNKKDFGAVHALISAEYEMYIKKNRAAVSLYNDAINMAGSNKKLHALAVYLYAQSSQNSSIKIHLANEAATLFRSWGAAAVADLIEKEFAEQTSAQSGQQPDLLNKYSALSRLGEECDSFGESDTIRAFISSIVGNGFADYCAFLYDKSDALAIGFESTKTGGVVRHDDGMDIDESSSISTYIARYSYRTCREITYKPNDGKTFYKNDPYLVNNTNTHIASFPVICHGITAGLIYMEKTSGGFDAQMVAQIKRFLPVIASKITTIKGIDLKSLFCEQAAKTSLSIRELEVLGLMSKGYTNQQISKELNIAAGTVKNHISRILAKLEADSRIKAVYIAKQQNLI